jgi:uncharacterized membrane protein YGL010W
LGEATEQATALLEREIGIADTVRFIDQFGGGHGNYTQERDALFGDASLDEITGPGENPRPGHR